MKVQEWPITKPKPYPRNPRRVTDQAVTKVADSLREFGFQQPLVVDKNGVIIVGHTRFLAAKKLNFKSVPVQVADLDPVRAAAYRLADNRTNEETEWNNIDLTAEFEALRKQGFDLAYTAFDEHQIDQLFANLVNPEEAWADMPEFQEDDLRPYRRIAILLADENAVVEFGKLIGRHLSPQTKWLWYPKEPKATTVKRYVEDGYHGTDT